MFGVSSFVLAVKVSQYKGFFKRWLLFASLFYAKRKNPDIVSISGFLGGAESGTRTRTSIGQEILSLTRLPFRHFSKLKYYPTNSR